VHAVVVRLDEARPGPRVKAWAETAAALSAEQDPDAVEPSAGQLAGRQAAAADSTVSAQWELPASKSAAEAWAAKESESLEQSRLADWCPEPRHELVHAVVVSAAQAPAALQEKQRQPLAEPEAEHLVVAKRAAMAGQIPPQAAAAGEVLAALVPVYSPVAAERDAMSLLRAAVLPVHPQSGQESPALLRTLKARLEQETELPRPAVMASASLVLAQPERGDCPLLQVAAARAENAA